MSQQATVAYYSSAPPVSDVVFGATGCLVFTEHNVSQWRGEFDTLHTFDMQGGIDGRLTNVPAQSLLCADVCLQFSSAA